MLDLAHACDKLVQFANASSASSMTVLAASNTGSCVRCPTLTDLEIATVPASGRTCPVSTLNSVVFPAPIGPDEAETLPPLDVEVQSLKEDTAPEGLFDRLQTRQ